MADAAPISFVIRTYNESAFLGRLFEVLAAQEGVTLEREIVVVDSGSTDGTVDIAKAHGVRLFQIAKSTFDYSRALNLGIEHCTGHVVAILSAHSIPREAHWLARMLSHFDDEAVAGVYSKQVAWPHAYWREARRIAAMFPPQSIRFATGEAGRDVPFSNAASCIRRRVWRDQPFVLPAAEDIEWATRAVANGHSIVYDATVSVFHSHDETCRQGALRLINLEKAADLKLTRQRRSLLTLRQGLGAVLRDVDEIREHTPVATERLRLIGDSMARSYWFVRDFKR